MSYPVIVRMLLQSGRMTDEKLECIRKKWQESIKKMNQRSTSIKNEKQVLLNIIKKIIKDRLDILKFFKNELKSAQLGDGKMRPAVELVKETQDIIEKLKTFEELSLSYPSSNYFHESFNNYIIEQQEAYEPIELDNIISIRG
ncbi:predicted protein [Naegleria gruberi]|uniref:Predicted protein n=1 Tax=Naegleria gruberi TaxID=5762 RepID=D2V5L0_NAEGR|nr:uncharacterized protein NAEGRDRAFT_64118 [Naegleria gruberi]EFC47818.1 predicted protein [Naegleria gruberi]|eukprot:XP_002680562.1 predicted protein [Naegleria gruberi strain NEG-M]